MYSVAIDWGFVESLNGSYGLPAGNVRMRLLGVAGIREVFGVFSHSGQTYEASISYGCSARGP